MGAEAGIILGTGRGVVGFGANTKASTDADAESEGASATLRPWRLIIVAVAAGEAYGAGGRVGHGSGPRGGGWVPQWAGRARSWATGFSANEDEAGSCRLGRVLDEGPKPGTSSSMCEERGGKGWTRSGAKVRIEVDHETNRPAGEGRS